jgi:predicted lipid-binding transport protein (Tim44 family)
MRGAAVRRSGEEAVMLRIAGSLCVVAVVGYVALHLAFGVAGGLLGLFFALAFLLLKALLALALIYFVLGIVAPDAARKVRSFVSGPPAL